MKVKVEMIIDIPFNKDEDLKLVEDTVLLGIDQAIFVQLLKSHAYDACKGTIQMTKAITEQEKEDWKGISEYHDAWVDRLNDAEKSVVIIKDNNETS